MTFKSIAVLLTLAQISLLRITKNRRLHLYRMKRSGPISKGKISLKNEFDLRPTYDYAYKPVLSSKIQKLWSTSTRDTENWVKKILEESNPLTYPPVPDFSLANKCWALVYTESNPSGIITVMDTGSINAVLPINISSTNMPTFKPIGYGSPEWKLTRKRVIGANRCPNIFKEGYKCSEEIYATSGTNSIIGTETIYLDKDRKQPLEIVTSYSLNNTQANGVYVGVIGLNAGNSGFADVPFLSLFESPIEEQNILFELVKIPKLLTEFPDVSDIEITGSISFNVDFNRKEFLFVPFEEIDFPISFNAIHGIFISLYEKQGLFKLPKKEMENLKRRSLGPKIIRNKISIALFDTGTPDMILDPETAKNIITALKNIYRKFFEYETGENNIYFCWPGEQMIREYPEIIKPENVIFNFILEGVLMKVSLKGKELFTFGEGAEERNCGILYTWNEQLEPGRKVLVIGYGFFSVFNTIFSATDRGLWLQEGAVIRE